MANLSPPPCCAQHSAIRGGCTAVDLQRAVKFASSHLITLSRRRRIHSSDDKASEKWVPASAETRIKGTANNWLGWLPSPGAFRVAPYLSLIETAGRFDGGCARGCWLLYC